MKSGSAHARIRAKQRFKINVGMKEFEDIRAQITQGKATLIEDQVLKKIYEVSIKEKKCRVVFDSINKKVITVLPSLGSLEWLKYERKHKGSPFFRNLPPEVPLDTDFIPIKI